MSETALLQLDGDWPAEVINHGFNEARTGTIQLWITFQTEHGVITAYLPLTDAAAEGSLRKLAAVYDGTALNELADGQLLVGRRAVISCASDEYQGRKTLKVQWINPEGWVRGPQRDESAASNAAKFDGLLAKIQSDKKKSKPDLPF
jgi:hypothetical protein